MKKTIIFFALAILLTTCSKHKQTINIVISKDADKIENLAANELHKYLEIIYPDYQFPVTLTATSKMTIYVGRKENIPNGLLQESTIPVNGEGFSIYSKDDKTGIITASGSAGLLYGVYELLGGMGYSFMFSGDYSPSEKDNFSFDDWGIINEPLVDERTVFNWHNFLSGCTAWDYADWELWINQSQKMGYNTIMVHAYANNPMFTFEYNGFTKPVGFLATSVQGRDWSTEHVNDIRRLHGGNVFESPVFGSKAGMVADSEKLKAVQQLMKSVFQHAEDRGMKVSFALDFDIVAAIPQEMVAMIPETDKFLVDHKGIAWMGEAAGDVWLPRPDKPEGYNYYKNQAVALLELYPQIDKFVLWRRANGSVWDELKSSEMPEEWQKEYIEVLERKPGIANLNQAAGAFAQAKLAYAYRKAFDELNRTDVTISYGTWRWTSLPAMNEFYPDFASIYILDSEVIRGELHLHNQTLIDEMATWVKAGKVIPVIWAHHDDGTYLGAPLPSFENFYNTLIKLKSNGFGVIHWMTRPFDMFFIHHNKQVFSITRNQSLDETLNNLGEKWFGDNNAVIMTQYLKLFESEMPTFGRETGPYFIDPPHFKHFEDVDSIIAKCDERLALLEQVDVEAFSKDQKETYLYFVDHEHFIKEFFNQQDLYLACQGKFNSGNIDAAMKIANQFQPSLALEKYAEVIQHGQITKGEQGILISMGVRWLPHFLSMKQLFGQENIRINFGTTSHEEMAQMAGDKTYFIDAQKVYWNVFGEKETSRKVFVNKVKSDKYPEIFEQGILLDSKTDIQLNAFSGNETIIAGKYILKMLLTSKEPDSRLEVRINDSLYEIAINETTIKSINILLDGQSNPAIKFTPQNGTPIVCGLVLGKNEENK